MERIILHCDINNCYASIECAENPALRGKPVAVCGDAEERQGIVLAKSMEAKAAGVQTGETVWKAKLKCPELTVLPPRFDMYLNYSRAVREIYYRFTSQIEAFGIDECWLDVTGSTKLFGRGTEIADKIRTAVFSELGITISVGVSFKSSQKNPPRAFEEVWANAACSFGSMQTDWSAVLWRTATFLPLSKASATVLRHRPT